MSNNSGKFEEVLSYASTDEQDTTGTFGTFTNINFREWNKDIDGLIPPCPNCTKSNIEFYFGRFWWLWLVAFIVYLIKK